MVGEDVERSRGRWRAALLVAVLCTAQALEVLGVTVVIVALPDIGADLQMPDSQLQLVVSLYAVLYGSLLLTAGRVADLADRRLVFAVGIGLTLVGAVCCAVASSVALLLVGRAVQGLGGAVVTPAALSLLITNFATGRARRRAVACWTAAAAGGGALGFAVGGLVVQAAGWRGVFWMLAPLAGLVLATLWLVVPAQPPPLTGRRGLDLAGSSTATAGLVLLVWGAGLVEHPGTAPIPPPLIPALGIALLVGFVLVERRSQDPLIRWSELTHRRFMTANGCAFVNTATTSASGTLVALVSTRVFDLDARSTGLVLLPFSIAVVLGSTTGGWWLRRRLETGMTAGLAVVAVAMLGLAAATLTRSVAGLAGAVALAGLGLSWAALTSTSAATAALDGERQGVASGAVNTAAQIGTALGVAVLITVAAATGDASPARGYATAFVVAAGLAAAYALLLIFQNRTPATRSVAPPPVRKSDRPRGEKPYR